MVSTFPVCSNVWACSFRNALGALVLVQPSVVELNSVGAACPDHQDTIRQRDTWAVANAAVATAGGGSVEPAGTTRRRDVGLADWIIDRALTGQTADPAEKLLLYSPPATGTLPSTSMAEVK
jgi:hypothetical protein